MTTNFHQLYTSTGPIAAMLFSTSPPPLRLPRQLIHVPLTPFRGAFGDRAGRPQYG